MRLSEIQTVKPTKPLAPLTPAQARLNALQQGVEKSRTALKAERDSQHRQRDLDGKRKQQATAPTLGKPDRFSK